MTPVRAAAACLALLVLSCRLSPPRHPVAAEPALAGATMTDNALLGLSPDEVRGRLEATLKRSGRFSLETPGARGEAAPWTLTLEVPFTREAQRDARLDTLAEVGATLVLEREGPQGRQRYEVVALGDAPVAGRAFAQRREALREALARALQQVVESAALQLDALGRPDEALVAELKAEDARRREVALRTLAERRHPAAAPLLVEQLRSGEEEGVRQAIGALVELRHAPAVPVLIELARGQEADVLVEILYALGDIGGEEAEAYLFTMAQGHDHPAIQAAAHQALDTLGAARQLQAERGSRAARPEVP